MTKLMLVNLLDICTLEQIPYPVAYAVHDEVVADVTKEYYDISKAAVESAWQAAGSRIMPGIPTRVDVAVGKDWGCKSE
jgi:DNA polymerase I-like protein with 3'-5' exonuclease and polymerase domains